MSTAIRSVLAILPVLIAAAVSTGCTSFASPTREAESAIAAGRYEEGLSALDALARENPQQQETRAALLRSQSIAAEQLIRQARNALDADRLDDAEKSYNRLLAIDPNNAQAKADLRLLRMRRDRNDLLAKAEGLLRAGDFDGSERVLRSILLEEPTHRKALALMKQISQRQLKTAPLTPILGPEFKKTISLEFRDAHLKDVFDAIWHASGVNFILDRDVRSDTKASIYVRNVTIEEAIDALLMTQQLAKKVVNSKTMLIYPKTPQKVSEYQDLMVRNFFLAYVDAKQMQTMLKTILKIKEVYVDEKRNLLVIRDNQEAVDMAEKLIRAHDQPDPEVMLAIDVVEIKRSKLKEVGIALPDQIALGVANPITVDALRKLNGSGINVGFSGASSGTGQGVVGQINLANNGGNTNMLANPRIRVRNREKAKIHIGDRLPVVTTTSSSTSSFVGQTVNYLDVGLKLEVEPQVMLDDDVVVKVNLEVSTASQSKVTPGFYDVGTRNTNTVLTIRDGETQVLAGLIRDDERESASRLPGIGDIPLLGRLFSNETKAQDKTEIILAITPLVLHNLTRPSAELAEYSSGTESGQRGTGGSPYAPGIPAPPPPPAPSPQQQPAPAAPPVPLPLGFPTSSPPASAPNAQPPSGSGVIPMIDFSPPPGVGSPPVAAPPAQR